MPGRQPEFVDIPTLASLPQLHQLRVLPHDVQHPGPVDLLLGDALRGARVGGDDSRRASAAAGRNRNCRKQKQQRNEGGQHGNETKIKARPPPGTAPCSRAVDEAPGWLRCYVGRHAESRARKLQAVVRTACRSSPPTRPRRLRVRRAQGRQAQADDEEDVEVEDTQALVAAPAKTPNGIAPASTTTADDRRATLMAALLAEHYPASPPDLAKLIQRVDRDRELRQATLHLRDGARILDHGDRLEHQGILSQEAADATAAAAAAHGWTSVRLTGSQGYRDMIASACALRQPPILTDHVLSPEAAERVTSALRQRAAAGVAPLSPAALQAKAAADPAAAAAAVPQPRRSARQRCLGWAPDRFDGPRRNRRSEDRRSDGQARTSQGGREGSYRRRACACRRTSVGLALARWTSQKAANRVERRGHAPGSGGPPPRSDARTQRQAARKRGPQACHPERDRRRRLEVEQARQAGTGAACGRRRRPRSHRGRRSGHVGARRPRSPRARGRGRPGARRRADRSHDAPSGPQDNRRHRASRRRSMGSAQPGRTSYSSDSHGRRARG